MAAPVWTEEERRLLKAAWLARERSAERIAEELSRALSREITRNAVLGRLHREGLLGRSKRRSLPKQRKARPRPPAPKPKSKVEQMDAKPEPFVWTSPRPGEGVRLLELKAHSCRWPLAAYSEVATRFCGACVLDGSSYCAQHAQRAFQRRA